MSETAERAPKDFQALRGLIAQRVGALPKRLAQVATYALQNPDEIAFGTVASIAAAAEVQPSTLVRFAHALGYLGFSDLQEVFRSRLRERVLGYDERLARMREHAAMLTPTTRLAATIERPDRPPSELGDAPALERCVG